MNGTRLVGVANELWDREIRGVVINGVRVLLARIDGKIFAYLNRCPHLGTPLSEGLLDGRVLTCRAHHWQFDITSGQGINPESACLAALPVSVDGNDVVVALGDETDREERIVGPVLLRSAASRALAEAIRVANPGSRIESRGAYLRVHAAAPCAVTREQVEAQLGAAFELPGDLERAMPSYQGRLTILDDEVRWD